MVRYFWYRYMFIKTNMQDASRTWLTGLYASLVLQSENINWHPYLSREQTPQPQGWSHHMTPEIQLNQTQVERGEQLSLMYHRGTRRQLGIGKGFQTKAKFQWEKPLRGCAMVHGQSRKGSVGTEMVVALGNPFLWSCPGTRSLGTQFSHTIRRE